jgi:nitroimidazol reductase NimA-like FMN-containing flavoprotein (pyridoxamine 5'-phosphate oxidase superfamily)
MDDMTVDRNGLHVLDRDECLALLQNGGLGRVALSMGALPTILPVNYRLVDGFVVFRTGVGSKLDAATRGAVIAFEVDACDPETQTGWSVVVTGVAHDTPSNDWAEPILSAAIPRWAPEGSTRVLHLSTDIISGRRIPPPVVRRAEPAPLAPPG